MNCLLQSHGHHLQLSATGYKSVTTTARIWISRAVLAVLISTGAAADLSAQTKKPAPKPPAPAKQTTSKSTAAKPAAAKTTAKAPAKKPLYSASRSTSRRTRLAQARAQANARETAAAVLPRYKVDAGGNLVPDFRGAAAIILNPETGEVLWEENSQSQRSIASITKVMTATVFLENSPTPHSRSRCCAATSIRRPRRISARTTS